MQRISLNLDGRTRKEVAKAWVDNLVAAIRNHDERCMVTVGVIPWALAFYLNARDPLFYAPEVSENLNFVSVHFYPEAGKVDQALDALTVYDIGKPLVIEEMFPLKCGLGEMEAFVDGSSKIADGWISFYWGTTADEYAAGEPVMAAAIMANWLEWFRAKAPEVLEAGGCGGQG